MTGRSLIPSTRLARREFLRAAGSALAAVPVLPGAAQTQEWRNRQGGMAYRRLGRTGMMISEVVCGGDPVSPQNYRHLNVALEMGLNYLDMAPQYGSGECERAYGRLISEQKCRDRVFLTTKVSGFTQLRERMYQDIYKGLPADKQALYQRRALELRAERGVEQPGYYLTYFPGQPRQFEPAYLRVAMMRDHAHKVEGSRELRRYIEDSLAGSLQRLGAEHFDLLMCPHGATTPEELRSPEIFETFEGLRRRGLVRFLGVTAHNDPAGILRAAVETGRYDAVMMAYNVINGGYLADAIREAHAKGVGVIAMKAAHAVATHHKALQPVPNWRVEKIHRIVPGEAKAPVKAYTWVLQNPHVSAVISNLWDEAHVKENLGIAGKKVELQPA